MLKKAFKTNPLIAGIAEQSGKGSQGKEFSTKLYVQAAAKPLQYPSFLRMTLPCIATLVSRHAEANNWIYSAVS
jgi:hypothetical protein